MKNISHKTATTGNWYAFSLPFYPAIFCPPQLYFSFTTDVAYLNLGIQIIYVKYVTILPVCIQSTCFIFGKIAHILQFILIKYIISHNITYFDRIYKLPLTKLDTFLHSIWKNSALLDYVLYQQEKRVKCHWIINIVRDFSVTVTVRW